MLKEKKYLVLAFYKFCTLSDPHAEVGAHKAFFAGRDITSRIYISENGINGQMCASEADAEAYMEWIKDHPQLKETIFKIQRYHEQIFPRQTVKYRKNLVAFDGDIDLNLRGEYLTPEKWKEALDKKDTPLLLDVRNDYEWAIGHFEGAELPKCESFRDFEVYAEKLKEERDPSTTEVMMYCTGGIRCELYSAVLKARGFEKVYQLEGGIINYGLKQGNDHWLGKLFVFDDRLSVPLCDKEAPVVGQCYHCQTPIENYYNCANMDCNRLFLCCSSCLKQYAGCCHESCREAPRLRPYHQQDPHKPFRKWHNYFKNKDNS